MKRRVIIGLAGWMMANLPFAVLAQQGGSKRRIGVLIARPESDAEGPSAAAHWPADCNPEPALVRGSARRPECRALAGELTGFTQGTLYLRNAPGSVPAVKPP